MTELPTISFTNAREWARWLAAHHASASGVLIKMARKGSGIPSITYPEAVDVALAWGWIDGQSNRIDDTYFAQKFTPRGRRSKWSKINCEKAEAMIAAGTMKPAGLAEVERARADGRWDAAYDSPSRATIPPDLAAALKASRKAAAFFETLDSRNRYAILHRIQTVKKADTRARNIAKFVDMLAKHEKIYS